MAGNLFEIGEMTGVSEAIQIDEPRDFGPLDDVMNQIRSDEARAAGDEKIHGLFFPLPVFE
jgi:hypothetical protein